jgi:hypothetical protein
VHEDLEQIASLKFGKAMEAIASETRQNVRDAANRFAATATAGIRSGQHEASLIRLRIDGAERIGRALFQIWVDLIVQGNGHIARADIDFIARKVEQFANAQPAHIRSASGQQHGAVVISVTEEAHQRMHALCAGIRRDLEIMVREYEAFPTKRQEGNSMADVPKKRYSVGRHVLVGMGMRPAVIKSFDDKPSVMGEYAHVVVFDDNHEERRVLGCDMQPVPALDQDLRGSAPAIHIQNSNVGNINLGSQIGHINVTLQQISAGDESQKELASALGEFTEAVVAAQLSDSEKQEVVGALSTIAEQATKKPEERSRGTLKAVVTWIPHAVATAAHLSALWEKFGPTIRAYFRL